MKHLQRSIAFCYGFVLMFFVSVWFTGFMAARSVAPQYFQFFSSFGASGLELGHAMLGVTLHLVPTVALILAGVLGAVRLARAENRRLLALHVLAGALASYVLCLVVFSSEPTLSGVLIPFQSATWWSWPVAVGPVLGIGIAYAFTFSCPVPRAGA